MKVDNLVLDSLFDESPSIENPEINKIIDDVFDGKDNSAKKAIKIEVLAPGKFSKEDSSEEELEENQKKIEALLKEAVGSEAVEKVLTSIEEEEKFSDYIDDSIFMRNQDIDLTGIEAALIRGCRIEKRLNAYRNKSEQCKKECEKLMEYEFFQSLNRVMEEKDKVEVFEKNEKIPYIISEDEYIIIKDNIENFYKERLDALKDLTYINKSESYIIVGENLEGEERIIGFIDSKEKALDYFNEIDLNNKSLSLANIEFLQEESQKIILDYEIIKIIK